MRTRNAVRYSVVVVGLVAAMAINPVTSVGAQTDPGAPKEANLETGRSHSRPPVAPICPSGGTRAKTDTGGDAPNVDIDEYEGHMGCRQLSFLIFVSGDVAADQISGVTIRLDTDEDRTTGCRGFDYRYEGDSPVPQSGFPFAHGETTSELIETPTCDQADWTSTEATHSLLLGGVRVTLDRSSIGRPHRVRWNMSVSATDGGVDRAPDRGSHHMWMVDAPSRPRYVRATAVDGAVELRWGRSDPGGGGPIEDYEVWVQTPSSRWHRLDDGVSTVRKATLTGFGVSDRNWYGVAAVSSHRGRTARSSWVRTPVPVPTVPRQLVAVGGDGRVDLSWARPASNGGASVSDYRIRYRPVGADAWLVAQDGRSHRPRATVDGLASGQAYEFTVAAVNAGGRGPWSDRATAATMT